MQPKLALSRRALDRRAFLKLATANGAVAALGLSARAGSAQERAELDVAFQESGTQGAFVLFDPATGDMITVNGSRAAQRFVPASTFKIANSLIALETGAVKDENEIIPYGGKPQPVKAWERDMSLREAIKVSNVPVYQKVARRVGLARYNEWLERLDYGNSKTGSNVERFWLEGPLEISPIEQARFVARLARHELPLSRRAQTIVRNILKLEEVNGRTLFAKTGAAARPRRIGWWTGWVERDGKPIAFALNIDLNSWGDLPKRMELGKQLLSRLDVL